MRVLIPYWIEHKNENVREFRDWATKAGETSQDILSAVEALSRVNNHFAICPEEVGRFDTPWLRIRESWEGYLKAFTNL